MTGLGLITAIARCKCDYEADSNAPSGEETSKRYSGNGASGTVVGLWSVIEKEFGKRDVGGCCANCSFLSLAGITLGGFMRWGHLAGGSASDTESVSSKSTVTDEWRTLGANPSIFSDTSSQKRVSVNKLPLVCRVPPP